MFKTLYTTAALSALTVTASIAETNLANMTWDEIVAQAKEEGELTWYVWYLTDDLRRFASAFEAEYGIKVTIPEGTEADNANKLLAERERDTGDIDVFSWGWDKFETVDNASLFVPLSILPEDTARLTELVGIDGEGTVLPFWGNQTGIAYDPACIADAADLPQQPDDFAAYWATHPGKFGFNYENGGSGPSFWQSITREITGFDIMNGETSEERIASVQPAFDWFNKHAENYVITTGNSDTITRISDGELCMGPAWEDHLAGLQKRGEVRDDIKFYIPAMGMNGGGNGVSIPLNAPNPAAAAVFIHWLTSAETQSLLNREFGTAPMHANADDSFALVPIEQRAFRTIWAANPFGNDMNTAFIENVILER